MHELYPCMDRREKLNDSHQTMSEFIGKSFASVSLSLCMFLSLEIKWTKHAMNLNVYEHRAMLRDATANK